MRNITLFSFMLISTTALFAQDTIANHGFETWDTHPSGYDVPGNWRTLNPLTSIVGVVTAYKTSVAEEVHSGSHAIKLVTKSAGGQTAPALVTTGQVNAQGIYGGTPINSRPLRITGWYRYFPVGNDNAIFEIRLRKNGEEIGSGSLSPADSVTTWTWFEFPITYTSSETPDSATLSFFASNGDGPNAAVNSTLFIDDVAYDYTTALGDAEENRKSLIIAPNPAYNLLSIQIQFPLKSIAIYSLDGKKVKEIASTDLKNIRVDDLLPGKYFISATPAEGSPVTKIFEIQR